ncbi:hypothetical protein [Flammeovirga aprica]|uniref:HTH luxR-type domain-containing protein n=1 Tax=Flammeovirga aprica JL-4 TaxID=694437 RepID=A0A7X9RXV8_9BACT|nr:hypothetical protein [Flammeovirga aprica]NME70788.1 hypothetical protein [Flammeovirga aprica JL-4]
MNEMRECWNVYIGVMLLLLFIPFGSYGKDTLKEYAKVELKAVDQLIGTAYYPEAYDKIWSLMSSADDENNTKIKYQAYKRLTLLYSIFYDSLNALNSVDSMFYYAEKSGVLSTASGMQKVYYTAAHTHRMNRNFQKAKEYLSVSHSLLDSLQIPFSDQFYVLSEEAHLHTLTGNFKQSEKILKAISKQVSAQHSYAAILYSMWGDLYSKKGKINEALAYYYKSLKTINEHHKRLGLRVELLKKISQLNSQLGNYKKAFEEMTASKELGDQLFGSQSARNKKLFEIKDSYRKSIEENKQYRKEQELKLLKIQQEQLNQQLIYLFSILCITILSASFIIYLLKVKHQSKQQLLEERSKAEIEIKKKELTVTSLQLIEKDKLLKEIKEGLEDVKQQKSDAAVDRINKTINLNTAKTWEDFEARFIQVNSEFYNTLNTIHESLTRNDLKLCALIKLNFSSKEIAQLLGISTDSVNKGRYRLRKKLGLHRDDNLFSYISSI